MTPLQDLKQAFVFLDSPNPYSRRFSLLCEREGVEDASDGPSAVRAQPQSARLALSRGMMLNGRQSGSCQERFGPSRNLGPLASVKLFLRMNVTRSASPPARPLARARLRGRHNELGARSSERPPGRGNADAAMPG
ncbi:hypothetical protein AAFF_G00302170 [Aldrovandia affinis]|uniref:Uncharacterized protein n=1 Tax=Aldrovandia affinis TaxID=143900 RepID=A0AAD7W128_9TELE|nr:hypothetical protein AAFF_G00302170 [Aldrovandia affinis]